MSNLPNTTTHQQGGAAEKLPLRLEIVLAGEDSQTLTINLLHQEHHSLPARISFLTIYFRSLPFLSSALLRVQQGADGEREAAEEFRGNLEGVGRKMGALRAEITRLVRELVAERDRPGRFVGVSIP
ncbi:MAG: hypothetical protein LQ350_005486 [Teloschistes chrysophthalmus]|nr:MAG: hypothetical protein LQ350_005486 [Niorma chrysophthalma]